MGKPGLKPGQKALCGAGRKKGQPNRQTIELKQLIQQACGEDYDPVVGMALIDKFGCVEVFDPVTRVSKGFVTVDPILRQKCAKEVAEYLHPKRKSIDIQTPPGEELNVRLTNDVKAADTLRGMLAQLPVTEE